MLDPYEHTGSVVPLSEAEREQLRFICDKRLRLFVPACIFLSLLVVRCTLPLRFRAMPDKPFPRSSLLTTLAAPVLLECLLLIPGVFIYRRRIGCFRRDLKRNEKVAMYYRVTQKQYFGHTGQYFIGLNHPDYLFQQVDAATWKRLEINDDFIVYRAPFSRYVFNPWGAYTVL